MTPFRTLTDRDLEAARSQTRMAEYEADRLREQLNAMHEREYESTERRRREREQEMAEAERQADNWLEALRKYKSIMQGELRELKKVEESDTWVVKARTDLQTYTKHADAALTIWRSEEQAIAPEIAALEAQIATLRDSVRITVANKLQAQFPDNDLSRAMLEDEPGDFLQTV